MNLRILFPALAVIVLVLGNAQAQTLKWTNSIPLPTNYGVVEFLLPNAGIEDATDRCAAYFTATDSGGGSVWLVSLMDFDFQAVPMVRVTWLNSKGAVVLTNDIVAPSITDLRVGIARLTSTELALQVVYPETQFHSATNVLRRFRKSGTKVKVSEKPLGLTEKLPLERRAATDALGFFTHEGFDPHSYEIFTNPPVVRRYAN